MRLRHKRPRPLDRSDLHRDARLFVVATEDTFAPRQYFEESPVFKSPRIRVLALTTEDGCSAPDHVLERLKKHRDDLKKKAQLFEDDEFWLMLDIDHWTEPNHIDNFTKTCSEAGQQGFQLAHSNPCFEVWLLLHFVELQAHEQFHKGDEVEERLRGVLGQYNKTRLDLSRFDRQNAAVAARRAEKLDGSSDDRWPQKTGTHVYRLVNRLFDVLRAKRNSDAE